MELPASIGWSLHHSRAVSFAAARPVQVAAEKDWVHKHAAEERTTKGSAAAHHSLLRMRKAMSS